jgi:hypothetical protein
MTIEPETLVTYSPAHVIAHCLNDMTFHGFNEADIREFRDELDRRMAEAKKMSEEKGRTSSTRTEGSSDERRSAGLAHQSPISRSHCTMRFTAASAFTVPVPFSPLNAASGVA